MCHSGGHQDCRQSVCGRSLVRRHAGYLHVDQRVAWGKRPGKKLHEIAVFHVSCCNYNNYLLVLNVGNGWEWGNGMIIISDYGSFPHSLLNTSKIKNMFLVVSALNAAKLVFHFIKIHTNQLKGVQNNHAAQVSKLGCDETHHD